MPEKRKTAMNDSDAPRNEPALDEEAKRKRGERRAKERKPSAPTQTPPDAVHIASDDSFPASDPPAWIWRR